MAQLTLMGAIRRYSRKATLKKYSQTEKFKATQTRYKQTGKHRQYRKKRRQTTKYKLCQKKYQQSDKGKAAIKRHRQTEKGKASLDRALTKFNQTEKRKVIRARADAKRRKLGFVQLNTTFGDSEGHHITEQYVLHIPKEVHHFVSHSIWSEQNMLKINEIAIEYLLNPMNYWDGIFGGHYDVPGEEEMLETAKSKPLFG